MSVSPTSEPESALVCDCKEWMRSACVGEPFYKEHEGKRYCVLHFPGKEKSEDFENSLQRKLHKKDLNFRGVWFPDELSFSGVYFSAKVDLSRATFSADVNFSRAIFGGGADFTRATFTADAYLNSAKFGANSSFTAASFVAKADFGGATFSANADFANATFGAEVSFFRSTLGSDADFSGATFKGKANFSSAVFKAKTSFFRSTFRSKAFFFRSRFCADVNFSRTTFRESADFRESAFSSNTYFSRATFDASAYWSRATFRANAYFSRATFRANAYFTFATFGDYVKFGGDEERAVFEGAPSLDLQFTGIERSDRVFFQALTVRPHWFVNVDPRKFDFINVDVDWRRISEEIESLQRKHVASPHRMLAIACRHLAVNAEENHRYEEASKFRYMAMDVRRREHWRGFAFWRLSWWYWLASGYGERVSQAFSVLLGIWLLSSLLYIHVGFARSEPKLASESDLVIAKRDDIGTPLKFSRALTYSAGVMTLQKPEPRPATTAAQTVVLLETILGPVQAALLALAIRRKFMR